MAVAPGFKYGWTRVQLHRSHARCHGSQHHSERGKAASQQPLAVVLLQCTTRGCEGDYGGWQEHCRLDCLCAVEGHGSAAALLRECVTMSPTRSLIELPTQHHKEGRVGTFPLEVKPQVCEYIAAMENKISMECISRARNTRANSRKC